MNDVVEEAFERKIRRAAQVGDNDLAMELTNSLIEYRRFYKER